MWLTLDTNERVRRWIPDGPFGVCHLPLFITYPTFFVLLVHITGELEIPQQTNRSLS